MADQRFRVKNGLEVGIGGSVIITKDGGNVGIGTTNPQTKLELNGVIGFTTYNSLYGVYNNILIGDKTTGANLVPFNDDAYGAANIFIGRSAGAATTDGYSNIFIGDQAGEKNTSGTYNIGLGYAAGDNNTTGDVNLFFLGGRNNTTGSSNIFLGDSSGRNNTVGNENIYIGPYNGISSTASHKIIIGHGGFPNIFDSPDTTKDFQFAVGVRTDANPSKYWLVGNENFNVGIGTTNPQTKLQINGVLGFGTFTVFSQTRTNIRIGDNTTGAGITSGYDNIFMGIGAGNSTTSGSYNNFFGKEAGYSNTSGGDNNFIGYRAGYANTTGYYNNFFGDGAGRYNTTGSKNNFFGGGAGESNTTGYFNSFLGHLAGYRSTTGNFNNFLGTYAGYNHTTGNKNNFLGFYGGYYNTTGSSNLFLGSYTGISTSASYKVVLGSGSDYPNQFFDSPDTTKNTQFAVGVRTDANPSKYWLVGNENFNVGIGTTNPTQTLHVQGNARVTGGLYDSNNNVGTAGSVLSSTGSGLSWIAAASAVPAYATSAGIATYATNAGVSTSVIGGIASVTQLSVSGVSTLGITSTTNLTAQQLNVSGLSTFAGITTHTASLFGTQASFTGIVTANSFRGDGSQLTGINTSSSVIGGIGSLTQLQVTGISTFTNGPVLVGAATSTGTASQPLQVTGGAYVSGSVGIGTTNPTQTLHVQGNARVTGAVYDSTNSPGTSGQVLQSTVSGTQWTTSSASGVGIRSDGTTIVGSGATILDFTGPGIATVTSSGGIATITVASEDVFIVPLSDETSNISIGGSVIAFRAPFPMRIVSIPRANVSTAATQGRVLVDIYVNGVSILGTNKIGIDTNAKTSTTAAVQTTLVSTPTIIADDALIHFDITGIGTGAKGLKVNLYYYKNSN